MPASVRFLEELDRAFRKGDVDEIITLGVRMLHMGWLGRLDWFLERFNSLLGSLSPEQLQKLNEERYPTLFYVVMYVVRDMDPKRALPYIRGSHNYIEKRIFHEYLGNHPRAYYYLLKGEKEMGIGGFWVEIRKLYFRLYKGAKVKLEEVDALETSEDELEFVAQVITKNYTVGLYHLLSEDIPEETFNRMKKAVMYGLSENYDHTTARLLQVFIPLAIMVGKRGMAKNLLNAVISTSKTEKNRYMYEWFSMYRLALTPLSDLGVSYLKRKVRTYMRKGYKGHEVLARTILQLSGEGGHRNLRRIKEIRDRYWHRHTVKFAEILTGGRLA